MAGTTQGEMGFGTTSFLAWSAANFAFSIELTWVYNNTRRSTLSAILVHFLYNLAYTIVSGVGHAVPEQIEATRAALHIVVAAAIVLVWGPETMMCRQSIGCRTA